MADINTEIEQALEGENHWILWNKARWISASYCSNPTKQNQAEVHCHRTLQSRWEKVPPMGSIYNEESLVNNNLIITIKREEEKSMHATLRSTRYDWGGKSEGRRGKSQQRLIYKMLMTRQRAAQREAAICYEEGSSVDASGCKAAQPPPNGDGNKTHTSVRKPASLVKIGEGLVSWLELQGEINTVRHEGLEVKSTIWGAYLYLFYNASLDNGAIPGENRDILQWVRPEWTNVSKLKRLEWKWGDSRCDLLQCVSWLIPVNQGRNDMRVQEVLDWEESEEWTMGSGRLTSAWHELRCAISSWWTVQISYCSRQRDRRTDDLPCVS